MIILHLTSAEKVHKQSSLKLFRDKNIVQRQSTHFACLEPDSISTIKIKEILKLKNLEIQSRGNDC